MNVNGIDTELLTNVEDKKKLLEVIKNCSDSMTRMAGEKEFIKESLKNICKELGLQKPIVSKMVKVYFKQNFDAEVAVQEEFENLYQSVIK